MFRNQKGFGLVGVFITVILLAAVGAVGWAVYQRQNKEEPKQASVTNFEECKAAGYPIGESYPEQCFAPGQTFVNEQQKIKDETEDWLLYETADKKYSLRLADGWNFIKNEFSENIYHFDNELAIKTGQKATIKEVPGGRDFSTGLAIAFISKADLEADPNGLYIEGEKQEDHATRSGLKIEKYYSLQTEEPIGLQGPKGTKSYTYIVRGKDGSVVKLWYSVKPDQTDYHEIVEKVAATTEIK